MPFGHQNGGWYQPLNPNEHTYTQGYGFSPRPPILIERRLISQCSAATVLCLVAHMFLSSFFTDFFIDCFFSLLPMNYYPLLSDAVTQLAQILAYALSLTIPFLIYSMYIKIPLSAALPFRSVPISLSTATVFASLGVSLVALYAADFARYIYGFFGLYFYEPQNVLPSDIPGTILYIINMTLLPAFLEEFAFRGILMQSFRRFGDSFALLVSSILFSLVHISPISMPHAFIMGLVIGYFVLFTGSLHTGMVIHFVYNLLAVIISQLYLLEPPFDVMLFHIIQAAFAISGIIAMIWLSKSYQNMFSLKNSSTINRSNQKLRCFFLNLPFFLFMITILIQIGGFLL